MLKKTKKYVAIALCVFLMATTLIAVNLTTGSISKAATGDNEYADRFMELYDEIHDDSNGYFSPDGVPYHSIETLMVEAPDYGHETTSETWSYYTWLEALYGKFTQDWAPFKKAWTDLQTYAVPSTKDQPNMSDYDVQKCASFCPGGASPEDYPVQLNLNAPTGADPFHAKLKSAYNTDTMYLMHWLFDTDNWYEYGNHGDGTSMNSQINTYQRGEQESVWETVPFPCWETLKWGNPKKGGFGSLYIKQDSHSAQWRYSIAGDADARAVQSTYWAWKWADDKSGLKEEFSKAAKMGDYLRYVLIDKYMKPIGPDTTVESAKGKNYEAVHYLISWYAAWGAPTEKNGWAWKEGSSASHQGYQNPMTAYALSTVSDLKPKASGSQADWKKSLETQLDFLQWLQSSEGAIAGGCNNSIQDSYLPYEPGISTFNGMAYDWQPVWHDPPSNRWFGFQTWGLQRLAEYYYETGNEKAKAIMDKWVEWVKPNIHFLDDGTFEIPSNLEWSGQPDTWEGSYTGNADLHCTIDSWSKDLGVAGSLANLLTFYAAKSGDEEAQLIAQKLLDIMWDKYRDDKGIAVEETRDDYERFWEQEVYIPTDFTGTNGQGAELKNGMTFLDMRPKYTEDPSWDALQTAHDNGTAFKITYHRFWAQVDIAMAYGLYGSLCEPIEENTPTPTPTPTPVSQKAKCDLNSDKVINMKDVVLIAKAFNTAKGDSKYVKAYDLNDDGAINMKDVTIIAKYFNQTV